MNKAYQLIWIKAKERRAVAVEIVNGRGVPHSIRIHASVLAVLLMLSTTGAYALPTGSQTVSGQVSINTPSTGQMQIIQGTNQAIINWKSFGIGKGEAVTIAQPSSQSTLLNRVLGSDPSQIFGSLTANGRVFLTNPSGILFAPGASVNVGGLVASSLAIHDNDFLAGNYSFFKDGSAGSVVNQGRISGGFVALLGSRVENAGTIITTKGTTGLAAGDGVTLGFDPNGLMAIKVNKGAYQAQVANSGVIEADGGMVVMTAQAADELLGSVVNTNGIVRAQTLATGEKGQIILLGGMTSGTVHVGGTLDASAPNGGDGGFVETSAAHVKVADGAKITTSAPLGKSGTWLIDPVDFTIAPTGGDMTGTALTAALSPATGGDVFIQSSAGDVNVNDEVEWSANKLTLHAYNTININAKLHGSGIATLALEYGQGSVDGEINGVTADYYIKAPVDLPAGPHFSTKLGANAAKYFTVITALGSPGSLPGEDLQGLKPDENYALGGDIDAVATVTWLGGAGFQPIAGGTDGFHGVFDGLGHTIKKLTIKPPDEMNIGLFSIIAGGGVVRNIGLVDATVKRTSELEGESDTLGILAGINAGTIYNSYATGTVGGLNNVGGLVGQNAGLVTLSYANVAVTGSSNLGGLVGHNTVNGVISRSYATGSVGVKGDEWTVGGLVGLNEGKITESYATGNVTGTQIVGGLVGENGNGSTITNTYSSGPVSGGSYAGGLAGMNSGTLANSFYDKSVNTTIPGVGDGTLDAVGAVEGKLTGDLKRLSTYTAWNSTIDANYNADAVWRITTVRLITE